MLPLPYNEVSDKVCDSYWYSSFKFTLFLDLNTFCHSCKARK